MPGTVRLINSCTGALPALDAVAETVGRALARPVMVERWPLDLSRAHDRSRRQYNSTALLAQLIDRPVAPHERLIAVVDVDLFIPVLSFVFGEAQLDGPAAVVSTWRLDPVAYGLPGDAARLQERLAKEITHELGHTLGLYHCRQFECVMRSSTDVEEIDLKRGVFCPECRKLLPGVDRG